MKLLSLGALLPLLLSTACGGSGKPAADPTAASPTPAAAEPAPPATEPAPAAPKIGPDECCCPFASAEGVAFNIMTKADCDEAGTGCVEEARCLEE